MNTDYKPQERSKFGNTSLPPAAILCLSLVGYVTFLVLLLAIWHCCLHPGSCSELFSGGYKHDNTNLCEECLVIVKDICCCDKIKHIYFDCCGSYRPTVTMSWREYFTNLGHCCMHGPCDVSTTSSNCWPLNTECACNCHAPTCTTINCCCFEIRVQESPIPSPHYTIASI